MGLEKHTKKTLIEIIDQMPVSVLLTDTDGKIVYVNPFCLTHTKYTQNEILGNNPKMFQSGKTPKAVYKNLWNTIKKGNVWVGTILNINKHGDEFWEKLRVTPLIEDGEITHFLAVKEDVTEQINELEDTRYQAQHDSLTGLMNRSFFEVVNKKQIQTHKRLNTPFSIMMLDLNHFKEVNDTYGHDKGDEILKIAAVCIQNALRSSDMACRIGGDEFAIMLDNIDLADVDSINAIGNRINENLKQIEIDGDDEISASIGVSSYPRDGSTYEALLKQSDIAMYKSKHHKHERDETKIFYAAI